MIVLYVLLAATCLARAVGLLWTPLADWHSALRVGLAAMFLFTGLAHFNRTRGDLIRMVPPALPYAPALVTFTGIAELSGAAGLLLPPTAFYAAVGLIVLLVAMFPANIYAARSAHTIRGRPHTPLPLRAALQLVFIGALWWSLAALTIALLTPWSLRHR